jgi:hypothetical protein
VSYARNRKGFESSISGYVVLVICNMYDFYLTKDKTLLIEPQLGGRLHRNRPELQLIEGRLAS